MSTPVQDSIRQQFEYVVLSNIFDKPITEPRTRGEARYERLRLEIVDTDVGHSHVALMENNPYYNTLFYEFSQAIQKVMPVSAFDSIQGIYGPKEEIKTLALTLARVCLHPFALNKAKKAMDEMYTVYSQASEKRAPKVL